MRASESTTTEVRERYFAAYNCDRDPFSDEGISGLFFAGGDRGKIVDELLHACRFMRSPVFLSGRQGSGKTAVLHEFQQKARSTMDVAVVAAELLQTDQQILADVLQAFGQPASSETSLLEQFVSWLGAQTSRQRNVVICFDDADNLGRDFLEPFFELVQHTEGYFTLVLAGAPDLESALESLSAGHDFTLNSIALPAFDERQVQEYANYRLQAAGFRGDIPLTDIQVKAAQRRSNGNIAYLNELLRDMLMVGQQARKGLKLNFPRLHAVLALLLLLIVLLIALRNQPATEDAASVAPPLRLETVEAPKKIEANNRPASVTEISGGEKMRDKKPAVATDDGNTPELVESEPASVVLAAESGSDNGHQTDGDEGGDNRLSSAVVSSGIDSPHSVSPDSVAEPDTAPQKSATPIEPDTSAVSSSKSGVEDQLSGWPDTGYALQVFGTHNAQRARQLVADFSDEADLLFYETLHNGKPWFVVIAGPYTGRQSAQASISELPASLQRLRPWPRNIASIKGDIERYRLIQKKKLN